VNDTAYSELAIQNAQKALGLTQTQMKQWVTSWTNSDMSLDSAIHAHIQGIADNVRVTTLSSLIVSRGDLRCFCGRTLQLSLVFIFEMV
jgi:hypothetical protein